MTRKMERKGLSALLLCLILGVCAQGQPITIAIEATVGTVADTGGIFGGAIQSGDTITGYYIYDSDVTDTNPSENYGLYTFTELPCEIFLSVGGFEFKTNPASLNFSIGISDNYPDPMPDGYGLRSWYNALLPDGTPVGDIYWQLGDSSATAVSTTELPITPPLLDAYDYNQLLIHTDRAFSIYAQVTEVELVPEPGTLLLVALGTVLIRRRFA